MGKSQSRHGLLTQIDRLQRDLDRLRDAVVAFDPSRPVEQMPPAWIRAILNARRQRDHLFGRETVGDAGWDILLELYARHLEKEIATVTSVSRAAAVPNTTGLRWIGQLEAAGLIDRMPDADDKRRVCLRLTAKGLTALERYFRAEQTGALAG